MATKGMKCPIHSKEAQISVDQLKEEISIAACCTFFKNDVKVISDRVLKAWKLHGEHLRARRDGRE